MLRKKFFLNFGSFLHQIKKILTIKYKKIKCYSIAWLFLFKMSHHSSLFPSNIHGDELILVLYSRGLGDLSVTLAQMLAGRIFFSQPASIKSRVLLSCCMLTYQSPFAY